MYALGNPEYRELQKLLFIKNKIIPDKYGPGQVKMPHGKNFLMNMANNWKKTCCITWYTLFQTQMTNPPPKNIVEDNSIPCSKTYSTHITFQTYPYHKLMKKQHVQPLGDNGSRWDKELESLDDYHLYAMNLNPNHEPIANETLQLLTVYTLIQEIPYSQVFLIFILHEKEILCPLYMFICPLAFVKGDSFSFLISI